MTAVLRTERLLLRPAGRSDVADLHRLWTDPEVRRYLWDDVVIPLERAAAVVEDDLRSRAEHGLGIWCVVPRGAGEEETVGFCSLRFIGESGDVEVLYGLAPRVWRRGYATEAARAVLRYAFDDLRLERVWAGADPPNGASFRVMERLGMRFAERRVVDGLEAIYYCLDRAELQDP